MLVRLQCHYSHSEYCSVIGIYILAMEEKGALVLTCTICGKTFSRKNVLLRHMRIHKGKKYACTICEYETVRLDTYKRHMKVHEGKSAEAVNTPGPSYQDQETERTPAPSDLVKTTTGTKRKMPTETPIQKKRKSGEVDVPAFVRSEHRQIYRENWRQIRTHSHINGQRQKLYNFMLESGSFEELENIFREVHLTQHHQYKTNYSFGFVLYNNLTGERRYYHASNNTRVLESPMLIQHSNGLNALLSILGDVDVLEYARRQRPNSQWVVEVVTNVLVYVYPLHPRPIGTGKEPLPLFIKNNPSIIALEKRYRGELIQDNLCFFRCLALHHGHSVHALERPAVELFSDYCKATDQNPSIVEFIGVMLHALRQLEEHFQVNIQVYSINEEAQAILVRRSVTRFQTTLYLNLHNNHFSYIKNFQTYSKAHKCRSCNSVFERSWSCARHERSCQGKTKFVFPGGVFKPPANIFTKLKQHAISIPSCTSDQIYPYRATYDIECYMDQVEDKHDTEKLSWIATHRVASISVCSNVPGYTEPKCFVSTGSENELVESFVDYLDEMACEAGQLVQTKYSDLTAVLQTLVKEEQEALTDDDDDDDDNDDDNDETKPCQRKGAKPIATLFAEFQRWMNQLPVIGFNSSKYDINAMKSAFFPALLKATDVDINGMPKINVIKKLNTYMAVTTDKLKIVDILNFLSPNTSLDKFLRSFKVPDS